MPKIQPFGDYAARAKGGRAPSDTVAAARAVIAANPEAYAEVSPSEGDKAIVNIALRAGLLIRTCTVRHARTGSRSRPARARKQLGEGGR